MTAALSWFRNEYDSMTNAVRTAEKRPAYVQSLDQRTKGSAKKALTKTKRVSISSR